MTNQRRFFVSVWKINFLSLNKTKDKTKGQEPKPNLTRQKPSPKRPHELLAKQFIGRFLMRSIEVVATVARQTKPKRGHLNRGGTPALLDAVLAGLNCRLHLPCDV